MAEREEEPVSSTYYVLCVSHDPATQSTEHRTPGDAADTIKTGAPSTPDATWSSRKCPAARSRSAARRLTPGDRAPAATTGTCDERMWSGCGFCRGRMRRPTRRLPTRYGRAASPAGHRNDFTGSEDHSASKTKRGNARDRLG